ncbi:MAG TPA: type II toxin-antitoxin system RelE/ParE family toxin [Verrucomicrobiae bacterium]
MNLHILASAFRDLADGRDFYERHDLDLGGYFLDSLFSDIDSLALYAGIHRKVFGFHRLLSRRFPYGIYYGFNNENVIVHRVLDLRQAPRKIRAALKFSK